MDISRELISMKRPALDHQIKENVPVLRMPIINEGDQLPTASPWSLPIIIEKQELNLMDQKKNKDLDFAGIDERLIL